MCGLTYTCMIFLPCIFSCGPEHSLFFCSEAEYMIGTVHCPVALFPSSDTFVHEAVIPTAVGFVFSFLG